MNNNDVRNLVVAKMVLEIFASKLIEREKALIEEGGSLLAITYLQGAVDMALLYVKAEKGESTEQVEHIEARIEELIGGVRDAEGNDGPAA